MMNDAPNVSIVGQHKLAPDRLSVEWSPWGIVCTYVQFGPYLQTAAEFQEGLYTSTMQDYARAMEYIKEWSTSGLEPREV